MSVESDALDEVTPELVRRIEAALAESRNGRGPGSAGGLSAAGQAAVLEQVSEPERDALVGLLKRDLDPEALTELDEEVRDDVLDQLDSKEIAAAARELETDDAASHARGPAGRGAARRSWPSCRPRSAPTSRARSPIPRTPPAA